MRLSRITNKVFTNILLGLRENFEKILGSLGVYFAKIIFRTPEENFEKVLCNRALQKTEGNRYFELVRKNFRKICGTCFLPQKISKGPPALPTVPWGRYITEVNQMLSSPPRKQAI